MKIWGNAPHNRQAGNDTRATQTTTQDIDARSARKNSGEGRKGCFVRVKGAWLNPYENGEGACLTGRPNAPALPTLLGVGGAGGAGGGWGPNSPADPRKETKFPRRSPYGRGEMAAPLHRAAPQILTHKKAGPTSACGRARMIPADNSRKAADRRRRFDFPKNLYVQIRGARRNLRAFLICSSSAPGPCRSAYKLTVPAAWLMRGVLPFARKCADQCPGAADRSKLE